MFIFMLGSLIDAVASNSNVFILGRAVAGLGSAGMFSGAVVLTISVIPLQKRPMYQGLIAIVFVLSSIIGPIIGGAFTSSSLTWRWCFWINMPVTGLAMLVMFFLLPKLPPASRPSTSPDEKSSGNEPASSDTKYSSIKDKFMQLDPIGTALFLGCVICLLLALQWGGSTYPWSDGRIIALWVLTGVLLIAFCVSQVLNPDNGTVPIRILKYRGVTAAAWWAFCQMGCMIVISFYLPIWFQAIQGVDAFQSSIRTLPFILAFLVAAVVAGPLVSRIGYYTPFLIAGTVLSSIGAGLMSTLRVDTPQPVWIGYQFLFGFGVGMGQQQAGLAAQTILKERDVPTGVAIKFFGQMLGGAVFASVGQNVLSTELVKRLSGLPGLDASVIVSLGATELRAYVGEELLPEVLLAYNDALDRVFLVGVIVSCLSLPGALLTEWRSIKTKGAKKGDA
jgi:MFS family permease